MRLALSLGLTLSFLLLSCSGNPSLPQRQIDHPYSLPEDTTQFSFGGNFVRVQNLERKTTTHFAPFLGWQVPINESWTWEILTVVRHQLHHDEQKTYGFRFGTGTLGYSSLNGFFVEPILSFYYKQKFSGEFALENVVGGSYFYRGHNESKNGWRTYWKLAPLFQIDETKALSAPITLSLERQYGSYFYDKWNLLPQNKARFTIPVGLEFFWRFSSQWGGDLAYRYRGIGFAQGFREHSLGAVLHHYW